MSIENVRKTRALENPTLKPCPYLKEEFFDGERSLKVSLRNYQKIGILNTVQIPKSILADDTGLGKTIQVLSSIGYIWMIEPEYVPIIVTTKSALFQWRNEIDKFMQGMDAVVVHGTPEKRHAFYEEFFCWTDVRKRVILLTYDMIMYDSEPTVIKTKPEEKIDPVAKKALKTCREQRKALSETIKKKKESFDSFLAEFDDPHREFAYASIRIALGQTAPGDEKLVRPSVRDAELDTRTNEMVTLSERYREIDGDFQKLDAIVNPTKRVNGICDYISEHLSHNPGSKYMLVLDEFHKLKNHKSQFHQKTARIAERCTRVVGMTATPIKNRLMEFFSLFQIISPGLFPRITHFQNEYCVVKLQRIGGGRTVPIIVGYKNLDTFKEKIEFYYLSRKKHDVAKELPDLLSMEVECELYDEQEELYDLAENAVIEDEDGEENAGSALSKLVKCQQAVDSPELILDENEVPFKGPSSKVDTLVEFVKNEAEGQKVIVFSRFEKAISLLEGVFKEQKIKCLRITGKENKPEVREKTKNLFQDTNSGYDIIMITMAGSESINLQAAEHFVFFDLPWSWGDYLQLIGRMSRIGSKHSVVTAHHYLGKRQDGSDTIDHHVLKALKTKKALADKVAGENLIGGLKMERSEDAVRDILSAMRGKKLAAGDKGSLLDKQRKESKKKVQETEKPQEPPKTFDVMNSMIDFSDI